MPVELYREVNGRKLRLGYTTGTTAALAAAAATRLLLGGVRVTRESLLTPAGLPVEAEVSGHELDAGGTASCRVGKDAGDDPDVTDGISIVARVRKMDAPGVRLDGGSGVGRVTKAGLDQPVGAAAINRGPREQIARAVRAVCEGYGYAGGVAVVLEIPSGDEIAMRTFNPHLGIIGGLSILGTSGLVEPMSTRAVVDTIALELHMHRAAGLTDVVLVPGNYGREFRDEFKEVAAWPVVVCANFLGEAVDLAKREGYKRVLLLGHLGKLVKLSGGVMDTHSRVADCRMELLALHAALSGADVRILEEILREPTVDAGLARIEAAGLKEAVTAALLRRIDGYLARRWGVGAGVLSPVGAVVFAERGKLLGISPAGRRLLAEGAE